MRRIICFALLGLLLSSGAVFAQTRPLARPPRRVIVVHRFFACPRIFPQYCIFIPSAYPLFIEPLRTYGSLPAYDTSFVPSPTYVFVGSDTASHPKLVFKDGTTYTVSDYWRENDQLHFVTVEEGGTKSVPHTVPFGDLDVQRTTDTAKAQGFRFLVRDEPIEQWLQHHSQHAPAAPAQRRRQHS